MRLRPPALTDVPQFLEAVERSRTLHRPWVAPPEDSKSFKKYVERFNSESDQGFFVVHKQSGGLAGVINVSNISRGRFLSAYLGYYAFADYAGKGLMHEGMRLVLTHVFREMKLHRVEANIQPGNRPSIQFIRRCGFVREGFSRRYLKLGGRWRDHQRWALLREDWQRGRKNG